MIVTVTFKSPVPIKKDNSLGVLQISELENFLDYI